MGEDIGDVELRGWTNYFDNISSFLSDLQRNAGIANARYCEYAADRLETCLYSAHLIVDHMDNASHRLLQDELRHITQHKGCVEELITYLQQIANEWRGYVDAFYTGEQNKVAYRVPVVSTGQCGRPRFQIERGQLEYLRSLSFSWSDIASLLGISKMTLYRYRRLLDMVDEPRQTLSDNELRDHITSLRSQMPAVGETLIVGYMRSNGYYVTRDRIRQSMCVTDPINTALRWRGIFLIDDRILFLVRIHYGISVRVVL